MESGVCKYTPYGSFFIVAPRRTKISYFRVNMADGVGHTLAIFRKLPIIEAILMPGAGNKVPRRPGYICFQVIIISLRNAIHAIGCCWVGCL